MIEGGTWQRQRSSFSARPGMLRFWKRGCGLMRAGGVPPGTSFTASLWFWIAKCAYQSVRCCWRKWESDGMVVDHAGDAFMHQWANRLMRCDKSTSSLWPQITNTCCLWLRWDTRIYLIPAKSSLKTDLIKKKKKALRDKPLNTTSRVLVEGV